MASNLFSSIEKAMKGVDNAIKLGTKRALNRSAASTRTLIRQTMRKETGLKSEYVNKRLLLNRTQTGNTKPYSFRANVAIAMRAILPQRLFNPRVKRIKTIRGNRYGVTTKVGKQGRTLIPGAFLMQLRNGVEIVAERKGNRRTPTKQSMTGIWQEIVASRYGMFTKFANDTFNQIVGREIDYALSKRESSNKNES